MLLCVILGERTYLLTNKFWQEFINYLLNFVNFAAILISQRKLLLFLPNTFTTIVKELKIKEKCIKNEIFNNPTTF